jgi:hypothetical protein
MSAKRQAFRERDFDRALKIAQKRGLPIRKTTILPDGRIEIDHGDAGKASVPPVADGTGWEDA